MKVFFGTLLILLVFSLAPGALLSETPEEAAAKAAQKEIEKLVEQFKAGDAEAQKKAEEQLVEKGEPAIVPLMNLAKAEDKALAERANAALARIGVVDGLYVRLATFHPVFEAQELIAIRFIFRNYGAKTVTVFNPCSLDKAGCGFSLTLTDAKSGKQIAALDMNNSIKLDGLISDSFAVLKPGDVFEDIAPLYNLFALKDIELTTYTLSGAYNGKTAINADILKKADLGIDNLYEGEVKARPISFSVEDPAVPTPDENTKKKIEQWVKELGDEGYGVRLEAEQNLVKEGSVVLPFLRQARSNADAEIRDAAKRIITQVLTNKAKMITFLGIHLPMPFVDEDKGVGVLVVKLIADSPAEKVGIKAGDLVLKIGDLPITQKDMATRAIFFGKQVRYRRKGDTIVLTIKRGEEEIKIPVTLAERNIDDPY